MDQQPEQRHDRFPSTVWTVVRLAAARNDPGAEQALEQIFRSYERPVLAYIQAQGSSPHDAEDLKQAFFEHLLVKDAMAAAVQSGVKLRVFLLTKLQSFLIDQHRRGMAQKRGGGRVAHFADLDKIQAGLAEPVDSVTHDSPQTAPAKRVAGLVKGYEKPLLGTFAALEIGLDRIRRECPQFNTWVTRLERLPA